MVRLPMCFIVLVTLFLGSCESQVEVEPCSKCDGEITGTFEDAYFQFFEEGTDTLVIEGEPSSIVKNVYALCSTDMIKAVNDLKYIKATGVYRTDCETNVITLVDIHTFEVVHSCLPVIPHLTGVYTLANSWLIHYIQTQDSTLLPPCEGVSIVEFDHYLSKYISGNMSANGFGGEYTELNDSTLQMPSSFIVTLTVGTPSQAYFENRFQQFFVPDAIITYSIDKNILTLKNKSQQSSMRLFIKLE